MDRCICNCDEYHWWAPQPRTCSVQILMEFDDQIYADIQWILVTNRHGEQLHYLANGVHWEGGDLRILGPQPSVGNWTIAAEPGEKTP